MYGGASFPLGRFPVSYGLSPHVRGSPKVLPAFTEEQGSIPACTGEPKNGWEWKTLVRVYPRMYGGATEASRCVSTSAGLSPHVRGSRQAEIRDRGKSGSIPACTGEPSFFLFQEIIFRVYPRMYGGAQARPSHIKSKQGLSPHVRGSPRRRIGTKW